MNCIDRMVFEVLHSAATNSTNISHFRAAGVSTNADECLEAVQSNLRGHSARFLMVYWICSTCKLFRACSKQLCCQDVNTIVGQSTSFSELALI